MYQINFKHEFEVHTENNCSGVVTKDYETKEEALAYAMKEAGSTRYTFLEDERPYPSKPKLNKTDDSVYFYVCVGEDWDIAKVTYYVTEQDEEERKAEIERVKELSNRMVQDLKRIRDERAAE